VLSRKGVRAGNNEGEQHDVKGFMLERKACDNGASHANGYRLQNAVKVLVSGLGVVFPVTGLLRTPSKRTVYMLRGNFCAIRKESEMRFAVSMS